MKHSDADRTRLASDCLQIGIALPESVLETLLVYLDDLLVVNERMNLTRITDYQSAIRLHVLDSLSALPEVESAPGGPLCDIGTGGGFPGLPLAYASSRPGVLLDSVGKKARAVEEIIAGRPPLSAIHAVPARAEQFARDNPRKFAVVTARAVAPLASLVELASPLLGDSGVLVALKGSPTAEELTAGDNAAKVVGLTRISTRSLSLPAGDEHRTVVAYAKTHKPRVPLPRREGLAQHAPLG